MESELTTVQIAWLSHRQTRDETEQKFYIAYASNDDVIKVKDLPYYDLASPRLTGAAIAWNKFMEAVNRYREVGEECTITPIGCTGRLRIKADIKNSNAVTSITLLSNYNIPN